MTDVRTLANLARQFTNIENALQINGYPPAEARALMTLAAVRYLGDCVAGASDPADTLRAIVHSLEKELLSRLPRVVDDALAAENRRAGGAS